VAGCVGDQLWVVDDVGARLFGGDHSDSDSDSASTATDKGGAAVQCWLGQEEQPEECAAVWTMFEH